jgi:hypothetical protein
MPRGLPFPFCSFSSSSAFTPPTFFSPSILISWLLGSSPSTLFSPYIYHQSCLLRRLPARPRRWRLLLTLLTAVCLHPECAPYRVKAIWIWIWSRISADSINIDMIKDAIISVSWSLPARANLVVVIRVARPTVTRLCLWAWTTITKLFFVLIADLGLFCV